MPADSARFSPALSALTGVVLLVALTGMGSVALAHNVVEDRIPVPESTITDSPVDISLSTDDFFLDVGGNQRGFAIVMVDSDGLFYGDGCVELVERHMKASVALGKPGTYSVVYQFVSADGHSLSESYTVEFEPAADHTPSPGNPLAPVCGVDYVAPEVLTEIPTPSDDVAPASVPHDSNPMSPIPAWAWVAPLVLGASGALWWFRSRKKRGGD